MPKNPREAKRLMERMGMRVEEISDVSLVTIKTSTREIVIKGPSVSLTHIQGQDIYQIMGGEVSEGGNATKEADITENDVLLVAQQTNVSLDLARKALAETQGDLAQAIILLTQRKG